jgi:hypothetical protein
VLALLRSQQDEEVGSVDDAAHELGQQHVDSSPEDVLALLQTQPSYAQADEVGAVVEEEDVPLPGSQPKLSKRDDGAALPDFFFMPSANTVIEPEPAPEPTKPAAINPYLSARRPKKDRKDAYDLMMERGLKSHWETERVDVASAESPFGATKPRIYTAVGDFVAYKLGTEASAIAYGDPLDQRYEANELMKPAALLPEGVNPRHREDYLSDAIFRSVFRMSRVDFSELPKWQQKLHKLEHSLLDGDTIDWHRQQSMDTARRDGAARLALEEQAEAEAWEDVLQRELRTQAAVAGKREARQQQIQNHMHVQSRSDLKAPPLITHQLKFEDRKVPTSAPPSVDSGRASTTSGSHSRRVPPAVSPRLPDGWKSARSRSTGQEYFFNIETGERQWSHPATPRHVPAARGMVRAPSAEEVAASNYLRDVMQVVGGHRSPTSSPNSGSTAASPAGSIPSGTPRNVCAQQPPSPPGWKRAISRRENRPFYYNEKTGERLWKLPGANGQGARRIPDI